MAELPSTRPEGNVIRTADLLGAFLPGERPRDGVAYGARGTLLLHRHAHRPGDGTPVGATHRPLLYYAKLLKDAGCTTYTSQLASSWLVDELAAKRALQDLPQPNIYRRFSNVFRRSNCAQLSMGLGPVSSRYYPYYPRSNSPRGTLSGAEVWAGSPTQ